MDISIRTQWYGRLLRRHCHSRLIGSWAPAGGSGVHVTSWMWR
ncbi:hypothetical protein [Mycolicibacterium frederiksbergense]|nr:hypothetical protein [Mycolicibacterium frederiksbergense]